MGLKTSTYGERGADFHARATIEAVAATGAMGPNAVIDVDFVNCFPNLEWNAIAEAARPKNAT